MKNFVTSAVLLALLNCAALGQETVSEEKSSHEEHHLWGDLKPGPFDVGYLVNRSFDLSRTYEDSESVKEPIRERKDHRLMEVRVWYPADETSPAATEKFGNYLKIIPEEGPVNNALRRRYKEDIDGIIRALGRGEGAEDRLAELLSSTSSAKKMAAPSKEKFPVVVYSLGHNMHSLENVVLWEYLASHGFVVAVTPSLGFQSVDMGPIDPTSTEVKVQDMEYLLNWLHEFPSADMERVAAGGFSFGGLAALLLSMRNTEVDAVIGLDPAFDTRDHIDFIRQLPFFVPSNLRVPLLHMRQDESDVDMSIVDSLHFSNRHIIIFEDPEETPVYHGAFASTYAFRHEFFPKDGEVEKRATYLYNRDVFELVAQQTRKFLEAYLKGEQKASAAVRDLVETPGLQKDLVDFEFISSRNK